MTDLSREARLSNAFVSLADTLVADFDLVDLLQKLVDTATDVLDVNAGGLLLKDADGALQVMASTSEEAEFVEIVQLGANAGPCWECVTTGSPVTTADIETTGDRWPHFRKAAAQHGFRAVHATPMRLRADVIGTLNLFSTTPGALNDQDIAAAQALSDVATIGILSERAAQQQELVSSQLQHALDSRIVIEQAKGVLSQSTGRSMDESFRILRSFARENNLSLRAVAVALVDRSLDPGRVQPRSSERRASPERPRPS